MRKSNSRLHELLQLYLQNNLALNNYEEFFRLLAELPNAELEKLMSSDTQEEQYPAEVDVFIKERLIHLQHNIHSKIRQGTSENSQTQNDPKTWKMWWSAVAACLLVVFGVTGYHLYQKRDSPLETQVVMRKIDVSPGKDAAVMIVGGQQIALKEHESGIILSDTAFTYLAGGESNQIQADEIQLITPKGGQYQLVLSDGTKVWMNAASKLTISSNFNVANRTVSLTGEAFFEVEPNKKLPFIIHGKNQDIKVLGTVFNVNTYDDEKYAKTTLVSGSLAINDLVLKPNEQAVLNQDNKQMLKQQVDASIASSWKEGVFDLNGLNFEECMRIIGRWYDLDVSYQGAIPKVDLRGKMSRGVKLSTFLDFLKQNTGVNAQILKDRKLIIN
ncbi:MAG: FecR family protein [Sphingobacterium sp.]